MNLPTWYDAGTVSVAGGSATVTGTGLFWGDDTIMVGDLFCDPAQPLVPPQRVKSVSFDDVLEAWTLELWAPWPGTDLNDAAYEIRYVGIIERSTAQSRKVLEQLGDVKAWYDVVVEDEAARLALETPGNPLRAGYRVMVKDPGVIWAKQSGAYGDWIGPVEFRGPIGPAFNVTAGPTTTLAPDQLATVTPVPVSGGVRLDFAIPRGPTGDINGVTPFWVSRLGADTDAAAAREGLKAVGAPEDAMDGRVAVFDGDSNRIKDSGKSIAELGDGTVANGRLTLESATAVSTTDQLAKTTIYWTPFRGNRLGLYVGGSWVVRAFVETTLSLVGFIAGRVYDIFAYDNAGTVVLEALVWTNNTTRATSLALQDGILVKLGDPTRRYLGTIYTSATGQTQIKFGSAASGGGEAWFGVWNFYNQVETAAYVADTDASHTYTSTTVRGWAGSPTYRVSMIRGLNEGVVAVRWVALFTTQVDGSANIGLGLDATSVFTRAKLQNYVVGGRIASSGTAVYDGLPGVGFHYVQALEQGGGTSATTFQGTVEYNALTALLTY